MRAGKLRIVPSRLVLLLGCQEKITNNVSYVDVVFAFLHPYFIRGEVGAEVFHIKRALTP